jgi:dihydrodipicolinate synthase/N-acetylneuraminate lyase
MTELTGVIPIIATPFDAAGRVDEESIVTLVEFEVKWPSRGSGPAGRGAARNEETIWPS